MLTFTEFEQYIKFVIKIRENTEKMYSAGVDLMDYNEPFYNINTILLRAFLKEDQLDFLDWWMYDCDMKFNDTTFCRNDQFMDIRMWDSTGKPIKFTNLQDIYNHLLSI
jgi:hypothetical protein